MDLRPLPRCTAETAAVNRTQMMHSKQSTQPKKKPPNRTIIGWREWASLPDVGVRSVRVKVDTGARTSALHAVDIEVVEASEPAVVRFRAQVHEDQAQLSPLVELPLVEVRAVKSSNGSTEQRPVVITRLAIGEEVWEAEVTLTVRDEMGFNMLLGRAAMRRRFWVDPGGSFLQGDAAPEVPPNTSNKNKSETKRA